MIIDESIETKTGGHWLMQILQSLDVNFVFGTTGAGMPDIQDAMVVVKPPKWIQGLHEFTSVCAAIGYASATEQAGVALIDRVVGTLNSAGAFYEAFLHSAPVVVLASTNIPGVPIPTGELEYHYSSQPASPVIPFVKWSTVIESLDTMPEDVAKTFFMAMSEHQGPTFITLRQDLAAATVKSKGRIARLVHPYISPRVPDQSTLKKICNEIISSQSCQVITSQLGRHASAVNSLVEFAHTFGIAVSETRLFVSYPSTDSLHVGFFDMWYASEVVSSTDLIIAIESGLLPNLRFKAPLIDLFSDPFHRQDVVSGGDYGSSLSPSIVRAICDSKPTLDRLVEIGKEIMTSKDRESVSDRIARFTDTHNKNVDEWQKRAKNSYESGHLDGWSVGYLINNHWDDDLRLVDGTQSFNEPMIKTIQLDKPGTYFGNASGHLGVSVGMAYGVSLANRKYIDVEDKALYKIGKISEPRHTTICTLGDGEAIIGNIPSALWTCQHYGLGVLYILLNNACWAQEWPPFTKSSQHWAQRANDFEFLDLDKPRIDFAKIASGLGVYSEQITSIRQFEESIVNGLKHTRSGEPALLDIQMEKFTGEKSSVVP